MKVKAVIITASTMKKTIDEVDYSGKCVTAYDLVNDRIIRLVSTDKGAPVLNPLCDQLHPLEEYEIEIKQECPTLCQTENVLFGEIKHLHRSENSINEIYKRFREIKNDDQSFILDGFHFVKDIAPYKHSLEIIRVIDLETDGKKCAFFYKGRDYFAMSLTDPEYSGRKEFIGEAILAISIPTEIYIPPDGRGGTGYYKFVSAVYPIHPWTDEEKERLPEEIDKGLSIWQIADAHKRTPKDIRLNINKILK